MTIRASMLGCASGGYKQKKENRSSLFFSVHKKLTLK